MMQKDNWYEELAAEVLSSILQTKEEFLAFRKILIDTFTSEVFYKTTGNRDFLQYVKRV